MSGESGERPVPSWNACVDWSPDGGSPGSSAGCSTFPFGPCPYVPKGYAVLTAGSLGSAPLGRLTPPVAASPGFCDLSAMRSSSVEALQESVRMCRELQRVRLLLAYGATFAVVSLWPSWPKEELR